MTAHSQPDELDVLRDVCRKLDSAHIAYMLTGSFAMMFYTVPRFTRDIDLVVELREEDAATFLQLFQNDYYVAEEAVLGAVSAKSMFNAIHNQTVVKVDFVVRKESRYRHVEFGRRQRVSLDKDMIWVVAKEDLIISKLDWARDSESEYQLRDIQTLVASGCDTVYINKWTDELGLSTVWNRLRPTQ